MTAFPLLLMIVGGCELGQKQSLFALFSPFSYNAFDILSHIYK